MPLCDYGPALYRKFSVSRASSLSLGLHSMKFLGMEMSALICAACLSGERGEQGVGFEEVCGVKAFATLIVEIMQARVGCCLLTLVLPEATQAQGDAWRCTPWSRLR